jgi:plasmid stability protein
MPAVLIRNLPEETHRALKQRATLHGVSAEAEIRAIIEEAVRPAERIKFGTALAELGRKFGGVEVDMARDPSPIEAAEFE